MNVKVGDAVSKEKTCVVWGSPGSVLGPLLFLLFINDLPESMKKEIKIFTDDVKMVVDPMRNQNIQSDLQFLFLWESIWLLKFNIEKCKLLHVGKNNPKNNYMFLDIILNTCCYEKDLGVTFNEKLNFHDHIYTSISKAKSSLA